MYKRLSFSLLGVVLLALSGAAQAQCENMRVIVRNSVYAIQGLGAFCSEFNKMKADLADMRSELSLARRENRMLGARLAPTAAPIEKQDLARLDPAQRASANREVSQ